MSIPILNIILAFVLFLVGLLFLEGLWQGKGKIIKFSFDFDGLVFPNLKDRRILRIADQIAFWICALMAILTLLNGLLIWISNQVSNFSVIFIVVVIFLSWPARIIFILINRNHTYDQLPRIWPFPK